MEVANLQRPDLSARPITATHAPALRLRLIGTMEAATSTGASVLPPGRKTKALLAVVALFAPRPVSRAKLADLLWGRRPELQARASLRQEIHRLGEALEPLGTEVLHVTRDHVALWPGLVWTDVGELREASGADAAPLALMNGTLLDGLDGVDATFDAWLRAERERLGDHVRGLAELRLGAQVEPEAVITAARQLLTIDRAHEGAWRALMRAYAARGERGMAVEAYERCRVALATVRDATPSAETEALLAELRRSSVGQAGHAVEAAQPSSRPAAPRIAVLPLQPIGSADSEFGVAIAEEITGALARLSSVCLLAPPRQPAEPDPLRASPSARRRLDTDLLIEGTLQRRGRHLRVLLRLLDLRAGDHVVWTRRFDDQADDPLALQDEIAAGTAAELDSFIALIEARRAAQGDPSHQSASDLLLRAVPVMLRLERSAFQDAGRLLQAAREREPANAAAHAWHALWYTFLVAQGWAADPVAAAARAGALAERAIRLDPGDARVLAIAGQVQGGMRRRPREALALFDRSLVRNPSLAMAWALSGLALTCMGELNDAERQLDRYKTLSPLDPFAGLLDLGLVANALLRHDHARAAVLGRQASELNSGFRPMLKFTVSALGHLGRRQEAALVMRRLMAIAPGLTVAGFLAGSPFDRAADTAHIAEGLRLAGLPAGTSVH